MTTHTLVMLHHIEVQKAVTSLKERAANTQDSTGQVVAAAVANLSQAGHDALPDIRYMKRTVQRVRVAGATVSPNPGRLTDLVIPVIHIMKRIQASLRISCVMTVVPHQAAIGCLSFPLNGTWIFYRVLLTGQWT